MDAIQFDTIPGSVILLQNMGTDDTVACSALVSDSYANVTIPEKRHEKLKQEMLEAGHWGTLDFCFTAVKIKCPIFVSRQIMRSSHMNFTELSGRYKEMEPHFYVPKDFYFDVRRKELAFAPEAVPEGEQTIDMAYYMESIETAWKKYKVLLSKGVRKEQARMVLPLSLFTEFWMGGRLSDWLHFLNLRLDGHAQLETQYIASQILSILRSIYPETIANWEKYAKGPINEYGTIQTP